MKIISLIQIIFLSLLTLGCEAAVIDQEGKSIRDDSPAIQNIEAAKKAITVKDLNVKGVIPYIDMETGKVTYNKNELTGHEFSIEVDFSVFQVFVKLGEDYSNGMQVGALNSGIKDFHAVEVALIHGYQQDSENNGLVIGNKFYDGGNGWTGFHMTNNVYLIKTRSGKYAKLQFLKAKQGNVDLKFYLQQDGSTNLKTEE